jgi:hypothetical protein
MFHPNESKTVKASRDVTILETVFSKVIQKLVEGC